MLPFIHTAETFYGPGAEMPCRVADRALVLHTPQLLPLLQENLHRRGEVDEQHAIAAWVEKGIWAAECPFCKSAQAVSPDDPFFLCAGSGGCLNLPVHGAYVPVVFPTARKRERIEAELLKRPQMVNRCWLPDETAADLRAENIKHGIETT